MSTGYRAHVARYATYAKPGGAHMIINIFKKLNTMDYRMKQMQRLLWVVLILCHGFSANSFAGDGDIALAEESLVHTGRERGSTD